nr:MAG TPA: hypothetical protein [Siphoviridae sp. ctRJB2]
MINLENTEDYGYDEWLEFFRKIPAAELIDSIEELKANLPGDGYAAAMRWLDIFDNPSKMDKLYKGRLDKEAETDIMDLAIGDDDEKFYESLIRQNVEQLTSSSISQQEVARLSQNINIFRKELRDIRSRRPKAGSVLEKVLAKAAAPSSATKKAKKTAKPTSKKAKTAPKAVRATKKKKVTKDTSSATKKAKK